MIILIDPPESRKPFKDLLPGHTFMYTDNSYADKKEVYLKVKGELDLNTVSLSNGQLTCFGADVLVIPVLAEVRIFRKQ
jgi:hypothetical protein